MTGATISNVGLPFICSSFYYNALLLFISSKIELGYAGSIEIGYFSPSLISLGFS